MSIYRVFILFFVFIGGNCEATVIRSNILNALETFNNQFLNLPGSGGPDGIRAVASIRPDNKLTIFTTNVPVEDTFTQFDAVWDLGNNQPKTPGSDASLIPINDLLDTLPVIPTGVRLESLFVNGIEGGLVDSLNGELANVITDVDVLINTILDLTILESAIEARLSEFNDSFFDLPGTGGPDGVRVVAMLEPSSDNLALFATNVSVEDTFTRFDEVWNSSFLCASQPIDPNSDASLIPRNELLAPFMASLDGVLFTSLLCNGTDAPTTLVYLPEVINIVEQSQAAIPEPTTLILFIAGLVSFFIYLPKNNIRDKRKAL